jgi:hypothetical protein
MNRILKILIIILTLTQSSFAQNLDPNLVSKKTELNLAETEIRGIECNKVTYFVEKDLQTISAYQNGKLKWKSNVISVCGKPKVGKPEIRYIKLKSRKLLIFFGKHSFAEVDTGSGKTDYVGAD